MKSKYEISVWEDVLDESTSRFKERKLIVIGSDTMTSESRAREPKMVNNINGTNKFTFNMYHNYIDTRTGEKVKNPYLQYLVNERKIKVYWKNKWYDLLIKQIKEDSVNHLFSYTCEDAYVTELSRSGFNLVFDTELENNIGTAQELIEKTVEDTDWQFDKDGSDNIYQLTEEPVYEVVIGNDFKAIKNPGNESEDIKSGNPALIFYSSAPDINNLKDTIQLYYCGGMQWQQDENDMLVINGTSYTVTISKWEINESMQHATAKKDGKAIFTIDFSKGLSTQYRAERYVQSQKTVYNAIVDRYVDVYNDGELLGYQAIEFNDASTVVNLVTNPSNFANINGWIGEELLFKLSPTFDENTDVSTYKATSFLHTKAGTYFNTGIQNNRSYIQDGFIKGETYIFRIKAKEYIEGQEAADSNYITDFSIITPSIESRDKNYNPTGEEYFELIETVQNGDWLEYKMGCVKSCAYEKINSTFYPFGLFITFAQSCWVEEAQFFKETYGIEIIKQTDEEGVITYQEVEARIDPGKMDTSSVAQVVWKYFNAEQPEGTTANTLDYVYTSEEPWDEAIPVQNDFERYSTIEASNSNRFNILQSIAEAFECWVRFEIEHDEKGNIIYVDGAPRKLIRIKREAGQKTGIGFVYGIDLKGVVRNIKSDKISTKTIVAQNENQFGKNGFCSIARSEQNYPRENVIYNFDYYIQHGLLDREVIYNDLYTNGIRYYPTLHDLNTEYANNLEVITAKKTELTRQIATEKVYAQYISSSIQEKESIEESIMKLAGTNNIEAGLEYARTHARDTKVQTLVNDRSTVEKTILEYQDLDSEIKVSIGYLEHYINEKGARQDAIIEELTELNKQFYTKYARFIQEGTWSSEDYWDDDLYYLDAVQVAYTSSRPQVSYEINVLRLSDTEDYSSKIFNLGDISFIQDVEYFGYLDDKITPYKEQVILTEITSFFDTPDKDSIKVQNYKTQFDDLFQRITAAVQNLEFTQGKYAKAANIVKSDGTIRASVIQDTFSSNKDLVYGAQNESATIDNTGITVSDNANGAKLVKVTSGGVFVTNDGGQTWKNAIRGDGISTDLLTAGRINTEQITVYNGEHPSFRWDPNGLNAYRFDEDKGVNTTQFVRFDQYGIYGRKNAPETWVPSSTKDIFDNADFGLTWDRFFMKSNRELLEGVSVSISTSDGISVIDRDGDTIFACDTNGAQLAGWKINKDFLESTVGPADNSIRIYKDGNIGCYGHEESRSQDNVYRVAALQNIEAIGLGTEDLIITMGATFYAFVSSVGKTKMEYQVGGEYDPIYDNPLKSKDKAFYNAATVTPPSQIQICYGSGSNEKNYLIEGINWTLELNKSSHITAEDGSYTTYTYYYNLNAFKNNVKIFEIQYQDIFDITKTKYIPASETKWSIDKNGDAIFHNIMADGGRIAGWFIDSESIYQTFDGTSDKIKDGKSNIKTELSSTGTATKDNFDYSIVTDAINAAMANIGGVLMSGGLINGYNIAKISAAANKAQSTANAALTRANEAYNHLPSHSHSLTRTYGPLRVTVDGKAGTTDSFWRVAASITNSAGS